MPDLQRTGQQVQRDRLATIGEVVEFTYATTCRIELAMEKKMRMLDMSMRQEINGPEVTAGSIPIRLKTNGSIDPMIFARVTAAIMAIPTARAISIL